MIHDLCVPSRSAMTMYKPAFLPALPVQRHTLRISKPCPRRVPSLSPFTISTQKLEPQIIPPSTPSDASPKPPLPSSSRSSLALSALLTLSALSIPSAQAINEVFKTGTTLSEAFSSLSSHYYIILFTALFGTLHSGLASLRPKITPYIGQRSYRVLFAVTSLPSAVGLITYFIAHRYDGSQLWQLQGLPHMQEFVSVLTAISFIFLYPATFNLLEVAAIQKPSFRIYEDGIMRITRHPQLTGQVLWCVAHTAWMGTSFTLTASLMLVAHHCFGAWNGDRRLRDAYGEAWVEFAKRTSVTPFVAMLDGRQKFVPKEYLRWAYVGVGLAVWAFYVAHPVVLKLVGGLNI